MKTRRLIDSIPGTLRILMLALPLSVHAAELSPRDAAFFETNVRPLLVKRCVECHGEKKQKAGLRLDAKAHAFKGGENGPVLVPGDSAKSSLFQRVASDDDDERMPPKGDPLTKAEVAAIRAWLDAGAIWPENETDKAAAVDKRLQHWSLQLDWLANELIAHQWSLKHIHRLILLSHAYRQSSTAERGGALPSSRRASSPRDWSGMQARTLPLGWDALSKLPLAGHLPRMKPQPRPGSSKSMA